MKTLRALKESVFPLPLGEGRVRVSGFAEALLAERCLKEMQQKLKELGAAQQRWAANC